MLGDAYSLSSWRQMLSQITSLLKRSQLSTSCKSSSTRPLRSTSTKMPCFSQLKPLSTRLAREITDSSCRTRTSLRLLILLRNSNLPLLTLTLKLEETSSFSRGSYINFMRSRIVQLRSMRHSLSKLREKISSGSITPSRTLARKWTEQMLSKTLTLMPTLEAKSSREKPWAHQS